MSWTTNLCGAWLFITKNKCSCLLVQHEQQGKHKFIVLRWHFLWPLKSVDELICPFDTTLFCGIPAARDKMRRVIEGGHSDNYSCPRYSWPQALWWQHPFSVTVLSPWFSPTGTQNFLWILSRDKQRFQAIFFSAIFWQLKPLLPILSWTSFDSIAKHSSKSCLQTMFVSWNEERNANWSAHIHVFIFC